MKKILLIILLLFVVNVPSISFATNSFGQLQFENKNTDKSREKSATRGSALKNREVTRAVRTDQTKIDDLKKRADKEIARRIEALNKLITRINNAKRLSQSQKTEFANQIQAQITALNTLKAKIDADTDLATLKTDVKSIVTDYRIFAFFIQYIQLLSSADKMQTVIDNLNTWHGKLQTRINEAQANGKDVTSLNTELTSMQTKIDSAKATLTEVNTLLTGLNVQGYPGNKTTLLNARTKLRTVFSTIKDAYGDARDILKGLKALGEPVPTSTATPTPTPAI